MAFPRSRLPRRHSRSLDLQVRCSPRSLRPDRLNLRRNNLSRRLLRLKRRLSPNTYLRRPLRRNNLSRRHRYSERRPNHSTCRPNRLRHLRSNKVR